MTTRWIYKSLQDLDQMKNKIIPNKFFFVDREHLVGDNFNQPFLRIS